MVSPRGEFTSRFGFVAAAAGSAVGLGNVWGFPTQAASNGGGAFLLIYLLLAFVLAYPVLMAELIIGRHAHTNAVTALRNISPNRLLGNIGAASGIAGCIVASLILSFYAIVAGWMIAFGLAYVADLFRLSSLPAWLTAFGLVRNTVFAGLFIAITIIIVSAGVQRGIERWSERLMPTLLLTLVALSMYVLTLDGAEQGLKIYLLPDVTRALSTELIIDALGSAFFSLSLGVGTMLIYGSYVNDKENLPALGGWVTLVDVGIAVLAGFLVLPAMYAALHNGVEIFTEGGALISEDTLIFTVLPQLFDTMGFTGSLLAIAFFFLMSIAALTSSISMLEAPVAYVVEEHSIERRSAAMLIGTVIALASCFIILNFDTLFGSVIKLTTRYGQPLLGFMFCIYAGWVWHRDALLQEIAKGYPDARNGLFWTFWPWHIRFICPLIILGIFAHMLQQQV
ncbi:MAG: sodium-dependent transporter [Halioglobus sp.]|nr:sodium-dependent transporter [Halioglobus sp.]